MNLGEITQFSSVFDKSPGFLRGYKTEINLSLIKHCKVHYVLIRITFILPGNHF